MTEQEKFRLSAFVNAETYEKIMTLQTTRRLETKRKVSQGEIIDEIFKSVDITKEGE